MSAIFKEHPTDLASSQRYAYGFCDDAGNYNLVLKETWPGGNEVWIDFCDDELLEAALDAIEAGALMAFTEVLKANR